MNKNSLQKIILGISVLLIMLILFTLPVSPINAIIAVLAMAIPVLLFISNFIKQGSSSYIVEAIEKENAILEIVDAKVPEKSNVITIPNFSEKIEAIRFLFSYVSERYNGVIAVYYEITADNTVKPFHAFALPDEYEPQQFELGEGIVGQVAKEKKILHIQEIPDDFPMVVSVLGAAKPNEILVLPICNKSICVGVLEFGFFGMVSNNQIAEMETVVEQIMSKIYE